MHWRSAVLCLALLAGACAGSERELDRLNRAVQADIRRGALQPALDAIADGERRSASSPGWRAAFRLHRAEVALLRVDAAAAAPLLEEPVPGDGPFTYLTPRRGYLLAQLRLLQRRLPEALPLLEDARRDATARGAHDVALDADALYGQALLISGKWQEAETVLQDAASRARARGDAYHQALALHNLGFGRVVRKRFDEALPFFEQLLELRGIEQDTIYGTALSNAGLSYARLGQFDRATAAQLRAVQSHEQRGLPVFLEQALGELGNSYVLQGDPARALPYLTRAFDVAVKANLTGDAALWAGNVATASVELGRLDEADRFNREGIRIKTLRKGNTLYNTLNAAVIADKRGQADEARRLYQQVLDTPDAEPAAQWEAHAGLGEAAMRAGDRAGAIRHYDSAVETMQRVRADLLRAEYRLTFLTRVIRFYQAYVDSLVASGDVRRALEVADSSRGVVLAERLGGGVTKGTQATAAGFIGAAARARSVWLSYWLAPKRSFVWVVSGNGIEVATLPGAADVERLVEAYRQQIEKTSVDPLAAPGTAGDALYAAVLAPIARLVPRDASVRIVADGALHGVNFETLPVPAPSRHYFIEDATIALAPSLSLLTANASGPARRAPASLLLVGDPTPRTREFPRLGYAPVEMASVAKHFDGGRVVRQDGDAATPAAFFAAGPEKFGVIHFTAHGSANRTSPLESAVILAGQAGTDRLYARDVAERALAADLVTISACRSAGERAYAGEGLIGFSWAFLRAGARQVVAGLWDVDDQSTAALMDGLYGGLARGESGASALRAAKLALMRRGGHVARPYYWGPFELFTVSP